MTRIAAAFARPPAFIPYFTLGYPDPETSLACVQAAVEAGANLVELGVPCRDPLADGPVIRRSNQIALENGITPKRCLEMTDELRRRGVNAPLVLMGYYNPVFSYGLAPFARDAAGAGADGLIVPDLPSEKADGLAGECRAQGLALIHMLPPNATTERIEMTAARASGFIYVMSVVGFTGERAALPKGLGEFVRRVKSAGIARGSRAPVAVGFGISAPAQAAEVGQFADGVIVGSAVIRAAGGETPVESVREFVGNMRRTL